MPENDGLIPQGWELKRIGDVCRVSGRIGFRGYTVSDIVRRGEGAITISPSNIKDGHTSFAKSTYISWEKWRESPEIQIENGDILLVKTGSTVGKSAVVQGLMEPATINPQLVVLKDSKINSFFLGAVMQGRGIQQQLRETVVGGALPTLSQREIENFVFLCPSRPKEIENLASVLSDLESMQVRIVDLLSKKRDIKQGVMQQLLTGRTRLPGFLDEWSIQRVGDFTDVRAGGTPSTKSPEFWGGDIPWMSSGEIHQKHITSVSGRITDEGLRRSAATWLPVGTVLMALAGQGKTRGTVGVSRIRLTTNQSLAGILPSNEHNSDYLFYNLESRYAELRGASTGDGGRGGLNLQIIKKLEIPFPTLEEQEAISKVLLQIDSEISLLEQKLAKVKDIKQGMMQQLLTGRVRLPLDQEVKA